MRILYVTQTFHPESLGGERLTRQALALQQLGHDVTVLTTMPNYPLGRVFAGYERRAFMREVWRGLNITRVWSVPTSNSGMIRRALSYLSFALFASVAGVLFTRRADLVIAAVPKPGTEFAGIVIARLRRAPLLLEMIDVLPENLPFIGISDRGFVGRVLARYYRIAYRLADLIAVLCESARDVIAEKGIDRDRIILWPNGADPDLLNSIAASEVRTRHGLQDKFVVVYAGSFSQYYNVPNIIDAARMLQSSNSHIHFLLLGTGPQWSQVRDEIAASNLSNVTLLGMVPWQELGGHLQAADAFLFSMIGEPIAPRPYHGILTAKACDYLLVGRPIICMDRGEILSPLLERISAGMHVPPVDPQALADAIVRYAADPKLTASAAAAAAAQGRSLLRSVVTQKFAQQLVAKLHERGLARLPDQHDAPAIALEGDA
jgi:glycosyltransferase involved in cell wall biosynthesis